MGIVFADALPPSENPNPAVPSAVTAAALVVRACFEACFTRGMVASFASCCERKGRLDVASGPVRLEMRPGASGSPSREAFF